MLTDEDLHYLLALNPGERMVTAWPDPLRACIAIGIEGDDTTDLPETIEGAEASSINRPYAMAKLRNQLVAIVEGSWQPDRDAYLRAVGKAVEMFIFPNLGVPVPEEPADGA